jgi:predicted ATP-binding protein involved in virulence
MNRAELGFDYEYVNIILDEVELYHHPEMQRTYLDRLLKGMEALNLRKIKGINIIFSTHSPFILSDIPKHNILRLEEGMPSEKKFSQTFGANIHELLANHFFLDNGFMGEFAKDYIMKLIKKVDDLNEPINKEEFNDFKTQIEIINEKFIKHKLLEKLESKYEGRFSDIDFLISKKQDELDQLKKRKNDQN